MHMTGRKNNKAYVYIRMFLHLCSDSRGKYKEKMETKRNNNEKREN